MIIVEGLTTKTNCELDIMKNEILKYLKTKIYATADMISSDLNCNHKTVCNNISMLLKDHKLIRMSNGNLVLATNNISKYRFVDVNNMIVIPDPHFPLDHEVMMGKIIHLVNKFKLKVAVFPGDFLDLKSCSYHDNEFESKITFTDEMQQSSNHIKAFLDNCPTLERLYIGMGNHEMRIKRATNGKISIRDALIQVMGAYHEKMIFIPFTQFIINNWLFAHPTKARDAHYWAKVLSRKYPNNNIVVAHQHSNAFLRDPSNNHYLIDIGCVANPDLLKYTQETNRYPLTQMGFLLIKKDNFLMFDEFNQMII